jgi:Helix-turn-helix domain
MQPRHRYRIEPTDTHQVMSERAFGCRAAVFNDDNAAACS